MSLLLPLTLLLLAILAATAHNFDAEAEWKKLGAIEDPKTREPVILKLIQHAIRMDDARRVDEILERYGYSTLYQDTFEATILHDRLDILKILASHGADLGGWRGKESRSYSVGLTLLDNAVQFGRVSIAEWLMLEMAVGSEFITARNASLLHMAASFWNREMVEFLLGAGPWGVNERDASGHTPLHSVGEPSERKNLASDVLDAMLKIDQAKNPPPSMRAGYDVIGTVRVLIAAGADWDARDKDGMDPLALAAVYKNFDAVEALLAHGADPIYSTRFIAKDNGGEEVREARLSELAARAGHPPGQKGMLEVVRMVYSRANFNPDDQWDYDSEWKMRVTLSKKGGQGPKFDVRLDKLIRDEL